jgi:thioredoxin reductase (NADPH)
MAVRDLIIVGAGPSGLSAAIAAKARGLDYQVLEKGTLVNSIYHFPPQMVFFTTPELLEIGGLPFVSPYEKPTRAEALRYYRRVVDTLDLQITFEEQAVSIAREEEDGTAVFAVETIRRENRIRESSHGESARADEVFPPLVRRVRRAAHVVLAIGYYDHPNLLNVPGEDLPHVRHYYSEPHPFYRRRVVVVGGGNSAAESALELHRAGALVTIVHRWKELKPTIKYWVRPDIENRINEGSIAAHFSTCVTEIRPTSIAVRGPGGPAELPADAVLLMTGYHPDWDLLNGAGVALDDRGAPAHDSETLETNVPGLFVAGGAISGKDTAPIFIENGRFHGEKIVETIAKRQQP